MNPATWLTSVLWVGMLICTHMPAAYAGESAPKHWMDRFDDYGRIIFKMDMKIMELKQEAKRLQEQIDSQQGKVDKIHARVMDTQPVLNDTADFMDQAHGRLLTVTGKLEDLEIAARKQMLADPQAQNLQMQVDLAKAKLITAKAKVDSDHQNRQAYPQLKRELDAAEQSMQPHEHAAEQDTAAITAKIQQLRQSLDQMDATTQALEKECQDADQSQRQAEQALQEFKDARQAQLHARPDFQTASRKVQEAMQEYQRCRERYVRENADFDKMMKEMAAQTKTLKQLKNDKEKVLSTMKTCEMERNAAQKAQDQLKRDRK